MMISSFGSSSSAPLLLLTCFLTAQLLISSSVSDGRCLDYERRVLLQFKKDLEDPANLLSSWQGPDCCKWMGVSCDNQTGLVTGIDLHNPYPLKFSFANESGVWNLSGSINPSLVQLKSLSYLDLSGSMFASIPIPEFIGSIAGLTYLNLSEAGFTGIIPAHLGNLSMLQYLDLSSSHPPLMVDDFQWMSGLSSLIHLAMNGVDLSMAGVDWFHILNRLSSLKEMHLEACSLSGIAQSLPLVNLTSLAVMDLAFNSFSSAVPAWFANLTSLAHLDIISAGLHGSIPVALSELPNLRYLDLSMNDNLTGDLSTLVGGRWRRIENLVLASDHLTGLLPSSVGNMTTLVELDLSDNEIEGKIPSSLGKLCNLRTLDLSGNNLSLGLPESLEKANNDCESKGTLPDLAHLILSNNHIPGILPKWLGELHNLIDLDLGYNAIQGPIPPSMGRLMLLNTIKLQGNELNGTLPQALGQLSQLVIFDVSSNQLTGTVTEAHFLNLTSLKILSMSSNSLAIDVSLGWVPPFHVNNLGMRSCSLGPRFPLWLQHQKKRKLQFLDISDASISGKIPTWFWDLSTSLSLLNASFNQMEGQLPGSLVFAPFADIDMRSNLFSGSIPVLTNEVELLDLSHNQFSGVIASDIGELHPNLIYLSLSDNNLTGMIPASIGEMRSLQVIELSWNRLMGVIPASLQNCSYLKALDLQHNNLSGPIPSLGSLKQLHVLHLSDNMLSGEIPSSLQHCSSLETLDLGNNELNGGIPTWLGGNLALRILRLRSNRLSGQIPSQLALLSSLQVLDLAENELVGTIPRTFGYLKGMVSEQKVTEYLLYGQYRGSYYEESMSLQVNGKELVYTKTLSLVTSIDLSGNKLTGDFPETLTNLLGLLVLDLSDNQLRGKMPDGIGDMHAMLSLDVSNNGFSGSIPSSMASMTFMSYLNLSNNNFSGRVPATGQFGTFTASAFSGNAYLCGPLLAVQCEEGKADSDGEPNRDGDGAFHDKWFYMSVGLGFAVGLLGFCAVILMRKSWQTAYFDFVDWMIGKMAHG